MNHLCYFCVVLLCFRVRLLNDALWSPTGKGLTSWLTFVMSNCEIGILGQVWCLIVSILDICPFSYLNQKTFRSTEDALRMQKMDHNSQH